MEIILDGKFNERLEKLAQSNTIVAHFWSNFNDGVATEKSALTHIVINLVEQNKELMRLARQPIKIDFNHDLLANYEPKKESNNIDFIDRKDLGFFDTDIDLELLSPPSPWMCYEIPSYAKLLQHFPTAEQVENSNNLLDLIEWLSVVGAAYELFQMEAVSDIEAEKPIEELLELIQSKIILLNGAKYFNPWNAFLLILLALLLVGSSFWIRYYAG